MESWEQKRSKQKKCFECQGHGSNADDGKSSHMTSLPQYELSEGFENVNFLKNDKKYIKYKKKKQTKFFTGQRKLRNNFHVLRS